MHVGSPDQIAVACKATRPALPVPALGPMPVTALWTPGGRPTLLPDGAHNAGLLRLLAEIPDVLTDFPARNPLVVMSAGLQIAHAARITQEQGANLLRDAEVDRLACSLMSLIADAALGANWSR